MYLASPLGSIALEDEMRLFPGNKRRSERKKGDRYSPGPHGLPPGHRPTPDAGRQGRSCYPGAPDASGGVKAFSDLNWRKEKEQTFAEMLFPTLAFFGSSRKKRKASIGLPYAYAIQMHTLNICIYHGYTYASHLHILSIGIKAIRPGGKHANRFYF